MKRFFARLPMMYFAPDEPSGGSQSNEQTLEQLRQQATEIQAKYDALNARIEKGELVDANAWLKSKVDAGELYTKDRFVGIQQLYQQEQESHKATKGLLTTATATEIKLKADFSKLETERADFLKQIEEKDVELETLTRGKKRTELIMEKYPELAPFEVKGLLPEGEDTELDKLFGEFSNQLALVGDKATKDFTSGGGPRTPGGKKETEDKKMEKPKDYLDAAIEQLQSGNQAGYDKLYDQYLQSMAKENVS
jgi:chromosome segregation ATPase